MNKKIWDKGVAEAKQVSRLLRLTNKHRLKIAEIAMRICDIKKGGRSQERYSIRHFGDEIGINGHTIHEWIRHKRYIFDKLTEKQKEFYYQIPNSSLKPIIKGIRSTTRTNTVRKKFDHFAKRGVYASKFIKYTAVLNTLIFNLIEWHRIKEVPDDVLKDIRIKCKRIGNLADKELSERKSGKKRKETMRTQPGPEEIWAEIETEGKVS